MPSSEKNRRTAQQAHSQRRLGTAVGGDTTRAPRSRPRGRGLLQALGSPQLRVHVLQVPFEGLAGQPLPELQSALNAGERHTAPLPWERTGSLLRARKRARENGGRPCPHEPAAPPPGPPHRGHSPLRPQPTPRPPGPRASSTGAQATLTCRRGRSWRKAPRRSRSSCTRPSRPLLPGGCCWKRKEAVSVAAHRRPASARARPGGPSGRVVLVGQGSPLRPARAAALTGHTVLGGRRPSAQESGSRSQHGGHHGEGPGSRHEGPAPPP